MLAALPIEELRAEVFATGPWRGHKAPGSKLAAAAVDTTSKPMNAKNATPGMIVARSCNFTTETSSPSMNTPIMLHGLIARTNRQTGAIQRGRTPNRRGSSR